ncbi:MFS transporter [Lactobacillus xylocopicola]|uniref:Lysosomal dipeptide transporter MFSD1 n=1 Tax=Lactobacillus xylocopicola TaxID=2976676 RepID=A0ABM8BIF2_9LACO|nr:MFS transporter [Lactobacillus xylocopicola]BDR61086.1 MFS transporter [Lactobacillus xylocopicola]
MEERQMPKLSNYRWVILAIVALLDAISNYIQFQISALATEIMPVLHISPAQLQSLVMAPMLIAVFLSIPAGTLADKFGAKKIVTIGLIISIIGAFGRLVANNFITMMIMLLLFGVYMALLNANTLKIFGAWFKQDTNVAMGIFLASASVGIILSRITSPRFSSVQAAYTFSSILLLVFAVCWMLFVKDMPKGEEVPKQELGIENSGSYLRFFKVAVKSKNTWIVAIGVGVAMGASEAFSSIMPAAFAARGLSSIEGNNVAAIATIGSLCGSLFGPAVVDKAKKAKPVMITVTALAGLLMSFSWFIPLGVPLTTSLVLGGLFGAMSGPLMQALPISFPEIGPKYAGSAGGLIGTVSLLFSYCIPVVISLIAKRNYMLTFIIQGIVMILTTIFMAILPDANEARRHAK